MLCIETTFMASVIPLELQDLEHIFPRALTPPVGEEKWDINPIHTYIQQPRHSLATWPAIPILLMKRKVNVERENSLVINNQLLFYALFEKGTMLECYDGSKRLLNYNRMSNY